MTKKKHRKFSEINSFPNVIQPGYRFPVIDHPMKGKWKEMFFHNSNPILLEVGCGKGEYTLALARTYPNYNFIGIDIKGDRIWTGASQAMKEALTNVGFLRIQAEHLYCFFDQQEVAGIWITFPDPQPNKPREKKRLTSPRFLNLYKGFLKPKAPIHLKTDNKMLFDYTLEVIQNNQCCLINASDDLYGQPNNKECFSRKVQTYYESIYLAKGEKICYLSFHL